MKESSTLWEFSNNTHFSNCRLRLLFAWLKPRRLPPCSFLTPVSTNTWAQWWLLSMLLKLNCFYWLVSCPPFFAFASFSAVAYIVCMSLDLHQQHLELLSGCLCIPFPRTQYLSVAYFKCGTNTHKDSKIDRLDFGDKRPTSRYTNCTHSHSSVRQLAIKMFTAASLCILSLVSRLQLHHSIRIGGVTFFTTWTLSLE